METAERGMMRPHAEEGQSSGRRRRRRPRSSKASPIFACVAIVILCAASDDVDEGGRPIIAAPSASSAVPRKTTPDASEPLVAADAGGIVSTALTKRAMAANVTSVAPVAQMRTPDGRSVNRRRRRRRRRPKKKKKTKTEICSDPEPGCLVIAAEDAGSSGEKLRECQGHCDGHSDCDVGLNCFSRSNVEAVPGCKGEGVAGKHFCYVPPAGELVIMANKEGGTYPLKQCQGKCDSDSDCDYGLNCFRSSSGADAVPSCTGQGHSGSGYCYKPPAGELVLMGNEDGGRFPLRVCEGDCNSDADCDSGLACFRRSAEEAVPGCTGSGNRGSAYCARVLDMAGDGSGISALRECQGDCDSDKHCSFGLNCFQRSGLESVPGCMGEGVSGKDYCYVPPAGELVLMGDGTDGTSPLQECQGDCDSDADCASGLECFQRSGSKAVPGCTGPGMRGADYCYRPAPSPTPVYPNSLAYSGTCSGASPCRKCEGDCGHNDDNCDAGLACFARSSDESVPGCVTGGGGDVSGAGYCHSEAGNGTVTYVPGEGTVNENGLLLSTGLASRVIATQSQLVSYFDGSHSTENFHMKPDGGAVFADLGSGGWIYVSNSESSSDGGVGAITFDSDGEVVGYRSILKNTVRNCGGGKTFWGTWLTCEETSGGQVWEVDPWGSSPGRRTLLGGPEGGRYESAAYDNRDPNNVTFYVTTDADDGAVVRFTPDSQGLSDAISTGNYAQLLHGNATGTAKLDYLVVTPDLGNSNGTYSWSPLRSEGEKSASLHFPTSEGIDIRDGKIYFTCKSPKQLFVLDIQANTYERSSTESGAFDSQPDQVARILNNEGILYFCEDGGDDAGVHGRDSNGNFYTILADGSDEFGGETTGLAFSPDNMHMYVSFQSPGLIFDITRTDGYPFNGQRLDIKYHADDTNVFAFS